MMIFLSRRIMNLRTEKAVKKVMALKANVEGVVLLRPNGNHLIKFFDLDGNSISSFTLQQIINKRYPKRKKSAKTEIN